MVLRPGQIVQVQAPGIQPFVHIAIEGKQGLAGVVGAKCAAPRGVAGSVELGQGIAELHQAGDVGRGAFAQDVDQALRLGTEGGQGVGQALGQGAGVVQGFGGGE